MTTTDQPLTSKKATSHPLWKFFWLSFLVVSLAYAWYSFYAPSNSVNWDNKIASTQEISNTFDKNTVLFFTAEWCSPCRIMKREVFANEEVEHRINSEFAATMVDIDEVKSKALVNHFKIVATPTTVIVNAEGEVLDYAVGKINKARFLDMLNTIQTK